MLPYRMVVNVATGHYVEGQRRLKDALKRYSPEAARLFWTDALPPGCPPHELYPYAFKAFALREARLRGAGTVLWADASIVPVRGMERLWNLIERNGYWISRNGWWNAEWTADAAYEHLDITREQNWKVPHVVATAFGLDLRQERAERFLDEYYRLSYSPAIQGPWCNTNHPDYEHLPVNGRSNPCGPANVRGHRHDQTIASVLAWKAGMVLTDPPEWFAYKGGETDATVLVADGNY